jgi:hypothetical protein
MERSMSEGRFLIYTIAAVMFFMLIHLYHSDLSPYLNPENYIAIHTILEFFSIAVSFLIFSYGWKLFSFTKSRKILMLSFLFFIVGVLDLLHTVTFKGMPFFITESSIAKATWFWVAARVAESLLIVLVLILPERQLKMDSRRICLALCTIVLGTIMYMIFRYEQSLPLLVIEGEGTTLLKNVIEYGVGFLHFISIVISLYFYHEGKDGQHLYVALAFTFLFLSELVLFLRSIKASTTSIISPAIYTRQQATFSS